MDSDFAAFMVRALTIRLDVIETDNTIQVQMHAEPCMSEILAHYTSDESHRLVCEQVVEEQAARAVVRSMESRGYFLAASINDSRESVIKVQRPTDSPVPEKVSHFIRQHKGAVLRVLRQNNP